jgi:hypothetical protein
MEEHQRKSWVLEPLSELRVEAAYKNLVTIKASFHLSIHTIGFSQQKKNK